MIRVLRVLEYEYDTAERMVEDQARWTTGYGGYGSRFGGMRMKSAVVSTTIIESSSITEGLTVLPVGGETVVGEETA